MTKRISVLALALMLLMSAAPHVQASAYSFYADDLGFRIPIQQEWVDAVQDRQLSFWLRQDAQAAQGGVRGYGVIYLTPDLSGFTGLAGYPEAEAWLNENCLPLAAVVVHQEEAVFGELFPDFLRTDLGSAGSCYFTLLLTGGVQAGQAGDLAGLAQAVVAALGQPGGVTIFDPDRDYGPLGMIFAQDLSGQLIDSGYFESAPLTLVNFWATYCTACLSEMPELGRLAQVYQGKVNFLGVVTDAVDPDQLALATEIVQKTGANYPHIPPQVSLTYLNNMAYVPTTIFLDRAGQQVGEQLVGGVDDWKAEIEARLAMVEQ